MTTKDQLDREIAAEQRALEERSLKRFSLREVADKLSLHRVTLLRMEQRGILPEATWSRIGSVHRIYSLDDIDAIRAVLRARAEARVAGKTFIEDAEQANGV